MKRRIFTLAACLLAFTSLMLVGPIRRATGQDTPKVDADDNVVPAIAQVIQGARGSCTPGSQGTCTFTLKWPTAFPSSTYTVSCFNLQEGHIEVLSRTAASLSLGFTVGAGQGSLEDDCIGVYP